MNSYNTPHTVTLKKNQTQKFNNKCVIVAAGENENDLNHSELYSNKTVMVIIINKDLR
jgi:hypothetical protein